VYDEDYQYRRSLPHLDGVCPRAAKYIKPKSFYSLTIPVKLSGLDTDGLAQWNPKKVVQDDMLHLQSLFWEAAVNLNFKAVDKIQKKLETKEYGYKYYPYYVGNAYIQPGANKLWHQAHIHPGYSRYTLQAWLAPSIDDSNTFYLFQSFA
jgi:hypothetical protein